MTTQVCRHWVLTLKIFLQQCLTPGYLTRPGRYVSPRKFSMSRPWWICGTATSSTKFLRGARPRAFAKHSQVSCAWCWLQVCIFQWKPHIRRNRTRRNSKDIFGDIKWYCMSNGDYITEFTVCLQLQNSHLPNITCTLALALARYSHRS